MSSAGSVTCWLEQLKTGDQVAVQKLWERYFQRLVGLARAKLQAAPRRAADEEDVALSAFDSFCRAAGDGRFPQLLDRDDLWQLLVVITVRKAVNLLKAERRQRRGGGQTPLPLGFSSDAAAHGPEFANLVSREPAPEFAAQVVEECQRLLACLPSDELRSVALWKMEGYTNEEIALKLGRSLATVERKLGVIRSSWTMEITP
jgi:DNA-directed RNA polymerase specialized sigma24 family protein